MARKVARAFNEPKILTSRTELAFWLVRITSRAELARYLNEPERAEPPRYPALSVTQLEHLSVDHRRGLLRRSRSFDPKLAPPPNASTPNTLSSGNVIGSDFLSSSNYED